MTFLLSGLEIWTVLLIFTANSIASTLYQAVTATLIQKHHFTSAVTAMLTCSCDKQN